MWFNYALRDDRGGYGRSAADDVCFKILKIKKIRTENKESKNCQTPYFKFIAIHAKNSNVGGQKFLIFRPWNWKEIRITFRILRGAGQPRKFRKDGISPRSGLNDQNFNSKNEPFQKPVRKRMKKYLVFIKF